MRQTHHITSGTARANARQEPLRRLIAQVQTGAHAPTPPEVLNHIVGGHASIVGVKQDIEIVAPTNLSVLVLGETGTGKELVAAAIHLLSQRAAKPYIVVNCATIPHNLAESTLFGHVRGSFTGAISDSFGKFHAAHGGTMFLDEVGELPLPTQAKLLRALQTGEIERVGSHTAEFVDVRIIAATNRNVDTDVFRVDLLNRLSGYRINLPALWERNDDIPSLAHHFIDVFNVQNNSKLQVTGDTLDTLKIFRLPGNVRQLRNIIECAAAYALFHNIPINRRALDHALTKMGSLELHIPTSTANEQLTALICRLPTLDISILEFFAILEALRRTGGSTSKAATLLGISLRKVQYKIKTLSDALGQPIDYENVPASTLMELLKAQKDAPSLVPSDKGVPMPYEPFVTSTEQLAFWEYIEPPEPQVIEPSSSRPAVCERQLELVFDKPQDHIGATKPETAAHTVSKEALEQAIASVTPFGIKGNRNIRFAYVREVAKTFGITADELTHIANRYGIDIFALYSQRRLDMLVEALATSRTQEDAGRKLGIKQAGVSRLCSEYEINWRDVLGTKCQPAQATVRTNTGKAAVLAVPPINGNHAESVYAVPVGDMEIPADSGSLTRDHLLYLLSRASLFESDVRSARDLLHAVAMGSTFSSRELEDTAARLGVSVDDFMRAVRTARIKKALRLSSNNIASAAEKLNLPEYAFKKWCRDLDISLG